MNRLQLWWFHFKMRWISEAEFDKRDGIIPCEGCGKFFKSYKHFRDYDNFCRDCEFRAQDPLKTKRDVERILTDYNSRFRNWEATLDCLKADGITVGYVENRCAWCSRELKREEPSLRQVVRRYPKGSWQRQAGRDYMRIWQFEGKDKLCFYCFKTVKDINGCGHG